MVKIDGCAMRAGDLIERLRARTVPQWTHTTGFGSRMNGHKPDELCHQAADEIERLLAELSSARPGNVKQPEPVAWYWVEDPWGANEWHWMTDSPESQECDPRDWTPVYLPPPADHLDAAVAAERERCAKLCDEYADSHPDTARNARATRRAIRVLAEAIRVGPL